MTSTDLTAYRDLSTPHVADACMRLDIPVRCAPAALRPITASRHITGETRGTSAEYEWRVYRETDRPLYELMRSWCGHRAITAHERRVAAEAEVHRLEVLATDLLDALRKGYAAQADHFKEALYKERITAQTIRPLVERPLDPSEIPVRVEYRTRGRWGG